MHDHKHHSGCCGCFQDSMARRTFLAAVGGGALGAATLTGCQTAATGAAAGVLPERQKPCLEKQALVVQPALVYSLHTPHEATSWRPWGGLHNESDVDQEVKRIEAELKDLDAQTEFPITVRPVAKIMRKSEAEALCKGDADVMLIYAASGGRDTIEALISPERNNLVFVRHRSGPVYLWYEIVHPHLLRKTVDEYGQAGLHPADVIVDRYEDIAWRMRALYALKNTVGSKIVCIGGPSGWGEGGREAPKIAAELWKMNLIDYPYEELGKRIVAARSNAQRVRRSESDAAEYLKQANVSLETDTGFVSRAFLLTEVFEEVMAEAGAQAMTINNCMSTIMPLSETTACLPLTLINDSGAMAFCESDFAVIPSGVLLHHIASMPVFLQDPTTPHHGMITLAHCTAPRKMDGKNLEKVRILTHFESDYGAAPKVDMRLGQVVTVIDPDFGDKRWIGFRGKIIDNPFLDICRSQVDVSIDGNCDTLMQEMRGFHWMLAYGDHLQETGYALRKLGVGWYNLTTERTCEA